MIIFSKNKLGKIYAVDIQSKPSKEVKEKLAWLLDGDIITTDTLEGLFIGPRKEMITPWSTNAVEITQNMGIEGVKRIEEFFEEKDLAGKFDPMLQAKYKNLDQTIFKIDKTPDPIIEISNIEEFNKKEGLALR
jgi:phosphoribosylformylglycinamidine synthase